ncbi:hypothetical protein, partial [Gemmatimonas sp.]|uniref:hypothetical protein n=1 Tax=Gemmatimonas sp. TaxID=1962908 RepID=UPI0035646495
MTYSHEHCPTDPLAFMTVWNREGFPHDYQARLDAMGVLSPDGAVTLTMLMSELAERCAHQGAHAAVEHFLANGSTFEDRVDRRAAVLLVAQLHFPKAALEWPGWQPSERNTRRRCFTDIERALVRFCACTSDACATTIGAADAGSASGELQRITIHHVGRGDDGVPNQLHLPGNERAQRGGGPSGAAPRTNELPMWCRRRFAKQLATIFTERPLLYAGKSTEDCGSSVVCVGGNDRGVVTEAAPRLRSWVLSPERTRSGFCEETMASCVG